MEGFNYDGLMPCTFAHIYLKSYTSKEVKGCDFEMDTERTMLSGMKRKPHFYSGELRDCCINTKHTFGLLFSPCEQSECTQSNFM